MSSKAMRCPSCRRPIAADDASCPYCGDPNPQAARRRVFGIALWLATSAAVATACLRFRREMPGALLQVLRSRPSMLFISLAAIAAFAPFPPMRAGMASSGMRRLASCLSIAAAALALATAIAALAVAALPHLP